jgi:flagellar M-ring protein FliF
VSLDAPPSPGTTGAEPGVGDPGALGVPSFPDPLGAGDPKGGVAGLRDKVANLLAGYSRTQKILAAVVVAAVVAGVVILTRASGGTDFAPLYTNLSPEDGATITQALEEEGVAYELASNGTTIMVPAGQVDQLRLDLAATALPSDAKVGYGVLDDQGLTSSEFSQRVGYQRAMEGELAKTIESIDVVDTAVVHLVIPDDGAFALDDQEASASVLVRTVRGETLDDDQVRAVVNLVASSIKGLSPEDVTVADSEGNVLAAPGQQLGGGGGGSSRRQTQQFEADLQASLSSLLATVVGNGGSHVTVSADLDYDETQVARETFEAPAAGPDGQPLKTEESTRTETYTGAATQASGVLGPDTPAAATGGGDSDYSLEQDDVRYAINRVVETTNRAPGQIERLSVAVLVDETKVSPAQLPQLTAALNAAAGIQADRGDVLEVTRTSFDTSDAAAAQAELDAAEEELTTADDTVRNLVILLAVLLIAVAAVIAYLRGRRKAYEWELEAAAAQALPAGDPAMALTEEVDLADVVEIEVPESDPEPELEPAPEPPAPAVIEPPDPIELEAQARAEREAALGELIEHQPEEVAALLRSWLADRRSGPR